MKQNFIQRLFNFNNNISTQNSLGIDTIINTGTTVLHNNNFSRTFRFEDISYRLSSEEESKAILSQYLDFINAVDEKTRIQYTFVNEKIEGEELIKNIINNNNSNNYLNKEVNDIIISRIKQGTNNIKKTKYLSFSLKENDFEYAKTKLNNAESTIESNFNSLKIKYHKLERKEKLDLINSILGNEKINEEKYKTFISQGMNVVDLIAPQMIDFVNSTTTKINNNFVKFYYLDINSNTLRDDFISSILDVNESFVLNMFFYKVGSEKSLQQAKNLVLDANSEKIRYQKKASRSGYDPEILPTYISENIKESENLYHELTDEDENYYLVKLILMIKAETIEEIDKIYDVINSSISKHSAKFKYLFNQADEGIISSLPNAKSNIEVERGMVGKNVATLIPFTTNELLSESKFAINYGINTISKNLILADRKEMDNPSGLLLGQPGFGKSFTAKLEILYSYLNSDDMIFVIDPENEYGSLARSLDGEIINISSSSNTYINPFDVDLEHNSNKIKEKSAFIISLIEIMINASLTSKEVSTIDRCLNILYTNFYDDKNRSINNMPTFSDFYKILQEQAVRKRDNIARSLVNDLEIYVTGSLNLFNNRTNINLSNRFTVFNIKDLRGNLSETSMFIINEYIRNKTLNNFSTGLWTRIYIDEVHKVLSRPAPASYILDMYKTFRKRGGILTGMTQNVTFLLSTPVAKEILQNSKFIIMLNQSYSDAEILAEHLSLSDEQVTKLINAKSGAGIISYNNSIISFENTISKDTKIYKIISTKFSEIG